MTLGLDDLAEPPRGAVDEGRTESLGLDGATDRPFTGRLVAVAVDAAGAGGARPYTYAVPPHLDDVEDGEAVLIAFGRRQALGVILGTAGPQPGVDPKPILDRVRADGPLLPPLSLRLASWIADHYLAPPALVIRSMLPPGLLERLELIAERTPQDGQSGATGRDASEATGASSLELDAVDRDLLEQLDAGPRPARDLAAPEGRAGLLRRLRRLASGGAIALDWTLLGASAGPRYERWVHIEPAGTAAIEAIRGGERPAGRPLGPRQVELLIELAGAHPGGVPTAPLVAGHGASALSGLVRRGLVRTEIRERPRRPLASRAPGRRGGRPKAAGLSGPQQAAVDRLRSAIGTRTPRPVLLDGVTGAGKTAVYVDAIEAAIEAGRPALVLVPEIAMALPLVDRLRADLDASIALVHSGLGDGERADEWRRIRAGEVDIVVGTRLAVGSPLADIGLVIVDEEHDPAYKSDRTPRSQARDVAVRLAELAGAACALGSATPAVDSLGRALEGAWDRIRLPDRPTGKPPTIEIVDLRAELADGHRGLISRPLDAALDELQPRTGEQAILVLNRRGTASVVLCRDCGHVQACPDCERPLVYHQAGGTLRCHHCGRAWPPATRCPVCGSPRIRYVGGGTERVEREVRSAHPELRVARLDRDVAERRGAAARVIDGFTAGEIDVLVGTSLVTKGLDVPSVTLVGVVSSDVALNLPDERAAERTYQLLAQAVGRAGRGDRPGRAFLQTYQPEHPAITAVATGDADAFYASELALRRRFGSPPFGQVIKLTVALADRDAAERAGRDMVERLRGAATGTDVSISGPAPAYIARRNDRWRFNVIVRGSDPRSVLDGDPGPPWSVDVDPESLL